MALTARSLGQLAKVKVKALAPRFCVNGAVVEVGQVVEINVDDAQRLVAAGHAEYVK